MKYLTQFTNCMSHGDTALSIQQEGVVKYFTGIPERPFERDTGLSVWQGY